MTSHIFFLHLKFKVLKESAFGFTPIKFTCALSFVTGLILPSSQQKIQITWISPSWYMDLLIDVFHLINRAKLSSENPNLSDIMNLKCIVYFSSDLRFVKKFTRPDFRTKNFTHKKCVICDYFYLKKKQRKCITFVAFLLEFNWVCKILTVSVALRRASMNFGQKLPPTAWRMIFQGWNHLR